jgi:hypothetical protein
VWIDVPQLSELINFCEKLEASTPQQRSGNVFPPPIHTCLAHLWLPSPATFVQLVNLCYCTCPLDTMLALESVHNFIYTSSILLSNKAISKHGLHSNRKNTCKTLPELTDCKILQPTFLLESSDRRFMGSQDSSATVRFSACALLPYSQTNNTSIWDKIFECHTPFRHCSL